MVRGGAPGADAGRGEALAAPGARVSGSVTRGWEIHDKMLPLAGCISRAWRCVPGYAGIKKAVPIFSWHSTYIGKVYYLINTSNKQCI